MQSSPNKHANTAAQTTFALEKRVLVVEDDPFWRTLIKASLDESHRNLKIDFTSDAEDALYRLKGERTYDLVISDYILEGRLNGYELYTNTREMKIDVPFLLTSGLDAEKLPTSLGEGPHFVSKSLLGKTLRNLKMATPEVPAEPRLSGPSFLVGLFGGEVQGLTVLGVIALVTAFFMWNQRPDVRARLAAPSAITNAVKSMTLPVQRDVSPAAETTSAPAAIPDEAAALQPVKRAPTRAEARETGLVMTPTMKAKFNQAFEEGDEVLEMAEKSLSPTFESQTPEATE